LLPAQRKSPFCCHPIMGCLLTMGFAVPRLHVVGCTPHSVCCATIWERASGGAGEREWLMHLCYGRGGGQITLGFVGGGGDRVAARKNPTCSHLG
jgi:hypothetical protein